MNPTMNSPHRPDDELALLAGEYVLGTLSAAQRRAVEQRLTHDTALSQAVAQWEERLLPLQALNAPHAPHRQVWQRIEATLGLQEAPAAAAPAVARPRPKAVSPRGAWWDSLRLWRGLSAGGFAAAAVLAAVLVTRPVPDAAEPKFLVVLVAPQDKAPGWVVQASTRETHRPQQVTLIPLAAAVVPQDKSLQFWTKADGWSAPVSLGLVQPGQRLQIPLESLPPLQPNQLFELTLEPPTGSPIGKPTGPIQFIGRAVKVL